ncbi:nucleoside-diphosphate kinase [bacterium]|nr:nucleoside-diphosphate kinase [bacterium]
MATTTATTTSTAQTTRTPVCLIIKPHAFKEMPDIMTMLRAIGVMPLEMRMTKGTRAFFEAFYKEHAGQDFLPRLLDSMTTGPCWFVCATVQNIAEVREAIGPTDPEAAVESQPTSIRAKFGTKLPFNALHMSDSSTSAQRELQLCVAHKVLTIVGPPQLPATLPVPE